MWQKEVWACLGLPGLRGCGRRALHTPACPIQICSRPSGRSVSLFQWRKLKIERGSHLPKLLTAKEQTSSPCSSPFPANPCYLPLAPGDSDRGSESSSEENGWQGRVSTYPSRPFPSLNPPHSLPHYRTLSKSHKPTPQSLPEPQHPPPKPGQTYSSRAGAQGRTQPTWVG